MSDKCKKSLYATVIKRALDFMLSLIAIIILSPLFLILTLIGCFTMRGNPFFVQERPGKNEKLFKLIKFRTMSNIKDENRKLLPDEIRLNRYGCFLRSTSLDELPELLNIFIGQMSIIGPRPLMSRYIDYYTDGERRRHIVRPGLTGYAQVHGRNALSWDDRFKFDVFYVDNLSFKIDVEIFFSTIRIVLKREGIGLDGLGNLDDYRQKRIDKLDNVQFINK